MMEEYIPFQDNHRNTPIRNDEEEKVETSSRKNRRLLFATTSSIALLLVGLSLLTSYIDNDPNFHQGGMFAADGQGGKHTTIRFKNLRSSFQLQNKEAEESFSSPTMMNESSQIDQNHENLQAVLLGGIIDDGAGISTQSLNFLVQMSCVHQSQIHILVGKNADTLSQLYELFKEEAYPDNTIFESCAHFHTSAQPAYISKLDSRIGRLQAARDHQRAEMEGMVMDSKNRLENMVVVLVDLDLAELPRSRQVFDLAYSMANNINQQEGDHDNDNSINQVDVLCANGIVRNYEDEKNRYYDTFATILLPDTFVYPLKGRVIPEVQHDEDVSLIVGKDFTGQDLFEWIMKSGRRQSEMHPVPVRSCFGGMGLYRASKFFDDRCRYTPADASTSQELMRYANIHDKQPCEHVTFNKCLQEVDPTTTLAIQPNLQTRWHQSGSKAHREIAQNLAISQFPYLRPKDSVRHGKPKEGNLKDTRRGILTTKKHQSTTNVNMLPRPIQRSDVTDAKKTPEGKRQQPKEPTKAQHEEGRLTEISGGDDERLDSEDDFHFWNRQLAPVSYTGKSSKSSKSSGGKGSKKSSGSQKGDGERRKLDKALDVSATENFQYWDYQFGASLSYTTGKTSKSSKSSSGKGSKKSSGSKKGDGERRKLQSRTNRHGVKGDKLKKNRNNQMDSRIVPNQHGALVEKVNNKPSDGKHELPAKKQQGKKERSSQQDQGPALAWLMSFPNSGTSYTLEMISSITGKPLATNYAAETDKFVHISQQRVPVFDDEPSGPFWLANDGQLSPTEQQPLVLTKTHCGGYCAGCSLRRMKQSYSHFLEECASDSQPATPYNPYEHVKKAVHLIRNPFDNVVSRYHHQVGTGKIKVKEEEKGTTKASLYSREAFREYCFQTNDNPNDNATLRQFLTEDMMTILESVPCRAEFFKYIKWHDLAFEATANLDIETLIVHYDQYSSNFESTKEQLLDFLEMTQTSPPASFVSGKNYDSYFTEEEREAVWKLFEYLSAPETRVEMEQYFDEKVEVYMTAVN